MPHPDVTRGSGNVFKDIGLSDPEARLLKAQVAMFLQEEIRARKLTQVQAAKLLKIGQSHVSELLNGHLRIFSLERLITLAVRCGAKIKLKIDPPVKGAAE